MSKILRGISKGLSVIIVTTLISSVPVFASQEGWIHNSDGTWSYIHNGSYYRNTWLHLNKQNWYAFNEDGIMETGWIKDGGYWYYLYSDGSMASNTTINGYRLNASGQWIDDSATSAVGENKKAESEDIASGNGTMVINYDGVQVFKNNTITEVWVLGSDGKWFMCKSCNTVPAKEKGKDDNLQNGVAGSFTLTEYAYTTLGLPPAGHEYIVAIKWKPRYRGVTIDFYKDNFSQGKEKELLFTKNI